MAYNVNLYFVRMFFYGRNEPDLRTTIGVIGMHVGLRFFNKTIAEFLPHCQNNNIV